MSTNGRTSTRRQFLRAVGWGAAGTVVAGALVGSEVGGTGFLGAGRAAGATPATLSLVATDGYITMPNRATPVYIFGFVQVDPTKTISELSAAYKGHAQHTAPMLDFKQEEDIRITLTNLGLVQRPDLTDSHTIHWHGFDIPTPLNDGVPEVSVAVPIGKQFTYFYRPHRAGTYMYHCHFEDVEHVQMGMTGIVFVRPTQDGTAKTFGGKTFTTFAYNDGDGSTGYDRHFAILLNEIEERQHDADRDIQEFIMTDYDPQFFTLNGRCYPQTVLPERRQRHLLGTDHTESQLRRQSRRVTAEFGAHSGQPGRSGAPAARQPRLPAARDAVAGYPDARGRPGRLAAAQRRRRHVLLDQHHLPRAG